LVEIWSGVVSGFYNDPDSAATPIEIKAKVTRPSPLAFIAVARTDSMAEISVETDIESRTDRRLASRLSAARSSRPGLTVSLMSSRYCAGNRLLSRSIN
jgi:hypothetical protein